MNNTLQAMLNLPSTYQKSGLNPTTATIIFLAVLSNYCSLNIANVISKVDGNSHFQKEVSDGTQKFDS